MIAFAVYVQQVVVRFRVGTICFLAEIKRYIIKRAAPLHTKQACRDELVVYLSFSSIYIYIYCACSLAR